MVSSKVKSKKSTKIIKPKQKSNTSKTKIKSGSGTLLANHRSKVRIAACAGIVLLIAYFSASPFLPVAANTTQVSWTSGDPTFSVDPDQTKTSPVPCAQEQIYLGNDADASTVCVVKRDTWRYGKYERNVCRFGSCSLEQGYAIGYGDDTKMYRMRDMPEFWAPYLVPGSNTMAVRDSNQPYYTLGIIKDFHLQFNQVAASDGSKEYSYNGSPYFKFSTPDGTRVKVQAVGASANGKWLVAEAPDVGLFRINLDTLETKRFSTTVYDYWKGSNPKMEFAVSNDGTSVSAMGFNAVFTTYSVNDACGDMLTDAMTKSLPIASPCAQKDMTVYMTNNVPGFQFGFTPSFDENAGMLNLQAYYQSDGAYATKWVTLTFATAPDAGDGNCLMPGDTSSTTGTKCCVTNRSYPQIIRQMMGKQAEKMKVTCSSADGSTSAGDTEAWVTWQSDCLNLETSVQEACKGISFEEFLQMYKGGTLKNVTSGN